MGRKMGVVVLITVLVCAASADPPSVEIPPVGLAPAPPPLPQLALPDELRKIRAEFGSPLSDSIFGETNETEVQEAFEKARASAGDWQHSPYPMPPIPQRGTEANLLEVSWKLERQAYQLDRRGEYELADALREVTKQVRERFREKANPSPVPLPENSY
ncbi:MAG TPA: hypothetical protein EYQ75_15075 [Planctomycetaceae bacterium]|nr:hypothetical protein [Planctomycetaceae bacterium]